MTEAFYGELEAAAGSSQVRRAEPMAQHTTFQVGGPADAFVTPRDAAGAAAVLRLCRAAGVPVFLLGNGSNLLVSDEGYRGVVVHMGAPMGFIRREGEAVIAGAGALLKDIAAFARDEGLKGFAFACGIPGSLGGAVRMNAGAYGGEMKDVVRAVTVLDEDLQLRRVAAAALDYGYRKSRIAKNGWLALSAELQLAQGEKEEIAADMAALTRRREEKQPLEYGSAGSTFKRPEGYFAGKLIMDAGLRGFSCGGAQVSEKHCGFVINRGGATAADVLSVIRHVQAEVWRQFQVRLEPEVRFLGFEGEAV